MAGAGLDATALIRLPLFASLSAAELGGTEDHFGTERHPRGAFLFRRGDSGDALYVVLDGQVALELADGGERRTVAVCGPGDWFGELALLTARPRTADARVTVAATLLRVDRRAWDALSIRAPRLFATLCERLSRQLRATTEPKPCAGPTVVACRDREEGVHAWVPALARSPKRQFPRRPVHALAADGTPMEAAHRGGSQEALERALARIVTPGALVLAAAEGVDPPADLRLERAGETRWVLEPGRGGRPRERLQAATPTAALDRVARHVAGGTVGLALGAGAAFGLAHLGLLEVLEREEIPVDVVAGTSMGAIVGAALAAGVPVERMIALAEGMAVRYRRLVLQDLALRGPSLLTGSGLMAVLAELDELRRATFEDLSVPFAAVAMDLMTGEEVILDRGPALEGIRPSFAMPGILPACAVDGRLLIDGAMANPVPVDRARVLGAGVVIASQPIPPLEPEARDPLAGLLGQVRGLTDWLPIRRLRHGLAALDTSLRSFQALWFRLARTSALGADVVVSPDLRAFWFLQFGAAREIIDAGRRAAEAALPGIRARLAEQVGLHAGPERRP
jgi:NTE family protein